MKVDTELPFARLHIIAVHDRCVISDLAVWFVYSYKRKREKTREKDCEDQRQSKLPMDVKSL